MPGRFNPPPGWPVPRDFVPPPQWQPDPAWPPAPDGWQLWIQLEAATESRSAATASVGVTGSESPPTPLETSPAGLGADVVQAAEPTLDAARLAPHGRRIGAFAVDVLIVAVVVGVFTALGRLIEFAVDQDVVTPVTVAIFLAVGIVAVLGLAVWLTGGQTVGKALFGLVERRRDGRQPGATMTGLAWSVGRHSAGYLVVDVLGVGTLLALVSPRRRCLHDLAFGSEVVYTGDQPADGSVTPTTWRAVLERRFNAFVDNLESGRERSRQRYRRVYVLWAWLTKVLTVVAVAVFTIARWTRPAHALSATPGTPPAASVHPAAPLTTKQAAGVWAPAAAAGIALVIALTTAPDLGQVNLAFDFGDVGRPETSEIYIMHADGSDLRQLTRNSFEDRDPDLFQDRLIAFDSARDGNHEIYVMNADGTGQRRLTINDAFDTAPDWSPDGRLISFTSNRDGNPEVYVMNADGTGQRRLTATTNALDAFSDWSPDGKLIAFTSTRDGNPEVYVMNADGTGQRRLTTNDAEELSATWSPDGTLIAFTSTRDGNREIYVMNADGTGQRRLTNDEADDHDPHWALGGRKILFFSHRAQKSPQANDVWAVNPDGTGLTRLTDQPR